MKKITDKDVEALKAGKKVTKGFIHMQLDDKGKLNLWSDINITIREPNCHKETDLKQCMTLRKKQYR